jgi:hypothetical protein
MEVLYVPGGGENLPIFVERSSTIECTHQPPPSPNLETNPKNYQSVCITERETRAMFHFLQFYNFQEYPNRTSETVKTRSFIEAKNFFCLV